MEVCLPECHLPGNFLSRAFGNIPGPVSVPPFETGQFPSCLSPKNETGTPEFEISGKIPKIQYWTVNFLLGTEICYFFSDYTE